MYRAIDGDLVRLATIFMDETIAVGLDDMSRLERLRYILLAVPALLILGTIILIGELIRLTWLSVRVVWAVVVIFSSEPEEP